jgi:hypothetical protein
MNSATKRVRGLEEVLGAPHLDDSAPVQHGHTVGDDHRLRLIVGHVEGGDGEGLVEPADLEAHFLAQVCVEIA